jgi:hypothetical protein
VTAEQIIREIEGLPAQEQMEVIRFAYRLDAKRQLTGKELSALAARLVKATGPEETLALREEIARGFYGRSTDA